MNQTLHYTAKKIFWTLPILIGITFLAFGLGLIARGDPATNRASVDPNYIPTEEEIQELRAEMGLDDPILVQYGRWIWNAVHGDLEESYIDDKPVLGEILRLLPNTLLLSMMALLVIIVVGFAIGGLGPTVVHINSTHNQIVEDIHDIGVVKDVITISSHHLTKGGIGEEIMYGISPLHSLFGMMIKFSSPNIKNHDIGVF